MVEVLDEDSRVEECFKNKVFIEELSSAQTILKVFTQMFFWRIENNGLYFLQLCLDRPLAPPVLVSLRTNLGFYLTWFMFGNFPQQTGCCSDWLPEPCLWSRTLLNVKHIMWDIHRNRQIIHLNINMSIKWSTSIRWLTKSYCFRPH